MMVIFGALGRILQIVHIALMIAAIWISISGRITFRCSGGDGVTITQFVIDPCVLGYFLRFP